MQEPNTPWCRPARLSERPKAMIAKAPARWKAALPGMLAACLGIVGCGQNFPSARTTTVAAPDGIRPLPAIFKTGKAVAYSAYRSGGPGAGEIPSDASILQDLGLLHDGGYNLLRLFGADAVASAILRLAAANYPDLRFQVGMFLRGAPASCSDSVNSAQMATGIALANQYSSVVTVSVGNETSFANNLPVNCLADYIKNVRSQVKQPVTADDDYTFFAGRTASGEKPDTILPLLDFVSIHIYAISNFGQWDWQQKSTAAGPGRATAMMNASLAYTQAKFGEVASYPFTTRAGVATTTAAALPIIIGETGWKANQTNSSSPIETDAANPVNAKEYLDLLNSWTGPAGSVPQTIFYFEAFDEAWKGNDDGWGLWDSARMARYALCGTRVGPACNADVYQGAGYFMASTGAGKTPAAAPSAPTPAAANVISLLSKTYAATGSAHAVDSWAAPWSGNVTETDVTIGGDAMKQYAFSAANGYAGIFFGDGEVTTTNFVDASAMTTFHMDVWMSAASTFTIQLVNDAQNAGSKTVGLYNAGTPATGTWVGLDIPLSSFAGLGGKNLLEQIILQPTTAATTVYVDNVYFHNGRGTTAPTAPSTAPTAPTLAASAVISLLSKTYAATSAAHVVDSWAAPWSGNVTETDVTIAGDAMKQYAFSAANGYVGIFFGDGEVTTTNFVDATGKTTLHMDIWMSAASDFTLQLVNDAQNAGSKTVGHYDAGTPATGAWVALDIPLSSFAGLGGQNLLEQMILQPTTAATTVYVDNVYFR